MSTENINPNKSPNEAPLKDKTELSDQALDKVSGGAPGDEFLKIGNTAGESSDDKHTGSL